LSDEAPLAAVVCVEAGGAGAEGLTFTVTEVRGVLDTSGVLLGVWVGVGVQVGVGVLVGVGVGV
jgi:hypothetical protein